MMKHLETKDKLKKQYWYYGVFPLVTVYIIGIFVASYHMSRTVDDCFITQSCSELDSKIAFFSSNIIKILMLVLTFYAIWNGYRIFKLTKDRIEMSEKIKVRIYVILFPVIAIISSPFLILFIGPSLDGSQYFAFLDYIIKLIVF